MGITPPIVSDAWVEGRMGDRVRHHRPDVLAQVEEQTRELRGERHARGATRADGTAKRPGPDAPPDPPRGPAGPTDAG